MIHLNHIIDILWQLKDPVNLENGESIDLYDPTDKRWITFKNENGKIIIENLDTNRIENL